MRGRPIKAYRRPNPFLDSDSDDGDLDNSGAGHVAKAKDKGKGKAIEVGGKASKKPEPKPLKSILKKTVGERAPTPASHRSRSISSTLDDCEALNLAASSSQILTVADEDFDSDMTSTPPGLRRSHNRSISPVFEPENQEAPLVIRHKTTLTRPRNNLHQPYMDGATLERARAIKAEIENNIAILKDSDAKDTTVSSTQASDDDAETALIKTLRNDEKMPWSAITAHVNASRLAASKPATLTDAAVYSRFVLSTTADGMPKPTREIGFHTDDYVHLRHPTAFGAPVEASRHGRKRVKNYTNPVELKDNVRKPLEVEESGDLESVERTQQLVEAVARIERNFWVLVADEMERVSTKFYRAEDLETRFLEL